MAGGLPVDNTVGVGAFAPMQIPGAFTFLTLPNIANLPTGVLCFTSDAGMCVWNGLAWGSGAIAGAFTPAGTTAAAINAAYTAASNAGASGTVYLGSKQYNLEISVVPKSGVKLKGQPPQLAYASIPDATTTLFASGTGTVLTPTGAFPAISWNTTVLGTPASQAAFAQGALTNIGFEDLGFSGASGGTAGILAGATNNPACWYSQFKNLYAIGFAAGVGAGISITNYQHCEFIGNYTFNCNQGQYHGIDVASATLAPGNSTYYDLYCVNSATLGNLSRGITFITTAALGAAADNNQFKFDRIQSNRFSGGNTTQAATMVNTQSTFTVTDGTKFAVGMPVTFSVTANGFTTGLIYFVVSVAANVLTVASTYGGAAITATGNTAINITTYGFPCFEMIALAGSQMTNCVIDNLDVEGGGTCAALFQNCNGFDITFSQVPGTSQSTVSVCGRSLLNATIKAPQSINTDFDGNSNGRAIQFFGAKFGTSVQYQGAGIWYDSVSTKTVLSLGYQSDTQSAGLLTFDPATAGGLVSTKNAGIGHFTKNINSASFTVTNLNAVYSNGQASGVTNTLPTVSAANAGSWVTFINHTANAQTISTDGVQLFNGIAARTSLTLNAGATVDLRAVQSTTAPAYTWDVTGGTSAMAAGVISAPT
jgi:hypothetical protein